jgi:hypothetical protein
MEGSRVVRHRFQSFWHGKALSPYELFCLQSFVTCGHDVDLYTYNANRWFQQECGSAMPPP